MKAMYVTDRSAVTAERFEEILGALRGAPNLFVQLREKEIADRQYLALARRSRELLGASTPLFVNGRFDVAMAAGADGVQLPEAGLPFPRVRAQAPRGLRVGISTHSPEAACRAIEEGADVVLLGPIFRTPSKPAAAEPLGAVALSRLPARSSHAAEVFAIGGIDEERLEELDPYRDRISGVAAIRLFQQSADPRATAERIARR